MKTWLRCWCGCPVLLDIPEGLLDDDERPALCEEHAEQILAVLFEGWEG